MTMKVRHRETRIDAGMASVADPERQCSIKLYIGASWSRGRDVLARQNVGQTNARSQDLHPDLLRLGCREVFFDETDYLRAAVAGHDDSFVTHSQLSNAETVA
jgi:hypothetical protein